MSMKISAGVPIQGKTVFVYSASSTPIHQVTLSLDILT